ncbi:hypothetical protein KCP74_23995 [Salmonella enterica subsp. enterica]|nr:hypothetical protein KCP74_23995 [Salmonella enterica subsp. enterica]
MFDPKTLRTFIMLGRNGSPKGGVACKTTTISYRIKPRSEKWRIAQREASSLTAAALTFRQRLVLRGMLWICYAVNDGVSGHYWLLTCSYSLQAVASSYRGLMRVATFHSVSLFPGNGRLGFALVLKVFSLAIGVTGTGAVG